MSGAFVHDPPSSLLPYRLNHAAWWASGQQPCVDPSTLIVLATNFWNHAVYRFSARACHVLCLPCEPLSLDWDEPHKNIPIYHCLWAEYPQICWERSSFGNVCHQLTLIRPTLTWLLSTSQWIKLQIQKHQWYRIVKLLWIVTQLIPSWNIIPACGPISPTFTQLFTVNLARLMQIWQEMAGTIIKKMKMARSIALLWCSEIVP